MIYIKKQIVKIRITDLIKCKDKGKIYPVTGYEGLADYNLIVPTNTHILLVYIVPYPAATCFG